MPLAPVDIMGCDSVLVIPATEFVIDWHIFQLNSWFGTLPTQGSSCRSLSGLCLPLFYVNLGAQELYAGIFYQLLMLWSLYQLGMAVGIL